jgi:2-methylcitrate dehydratase PrpD
MSVNLTALLSDYIYEQTYSKLSGADIEKVKLCFLDWVAVTLAGSREPVSEINYNLIESLGGKTQATLLGRDLKTNLLFAALMNATGAHALDYDDVHLDSSGHPSAPVIPALLALAEWKGLSGKEFINAFVVGVQVFFSVGAGNMPLHYQEGWHNTGTVGHIAAAAAAAKLLNLDKVKIANAVGTAVTQSAGLQNVFGTMGKPFNAGKAAMDGLLAALLAERGFTGPADALGGENGFFAVFSSKADPSAMGKALIEKNFLKGVTFKRYPSCFASHTAIDCMLSLKSQHDINPEDILEIEGVVYPKCLDIAALAEPKTGLEGKFSVQFCLALALMDGKLAPDSFEDAKINHPPLRHIMKKIKLTGDPAYDKGRASKVIIKFKNSKRIQKKIILSELMEDSVRIKADVAKKFKAITDELMSARKADHLLNTIESMEHIENMADIVKLCRTG